ncbi:MAG: site-2 protease family protein [bacterium]
METPIVIFVLLFSVIVHECAHGLAAERYGDVTARRLGRITLNPLPHIDPIGTIVVPLVLAILPGGMLFGWAKPVPVNVANLRDPARDHAKVAAAGPLVNLLLACVSAILLGLVVAAEGIPRSQGPDASLPNNLHAFLFLVFQNGVLYNVLLALFNLIPLPPLDGSWILMRFLRGSALTFYANIRPYGFMILMMLLFFGLRSVLSIFVSNVAYMFFSISNFIVSIFR